MGGRSYAGRLWGIDDVPTPVLLTTIDLLDLVRARLKSLNRPDSDYEAAKVLGVSQPTVSGWRTGRYFMGDDAGLAAAEFLEIEQEYVAACLQFERARTDRTRTFWRALAERIAASKDAAAIVFLSVFTVPAALAGLEALHRLQ